MVFCLLAYQVEKETPSTPFLPSWFLYISIKKLFSISNAESQSPLLSLGFKSAFSVTSFQTTFHLGGQWLMPALNLNLSPCTHCSSVVFAQLELMGNFFLYHPQEIKKQKQTTDTHMAIEDKGCHCTAMVCKLHSCKELCHSHLLWQLRTDAFQWLKTQCLYLVHKGNGSYACNCKELMELNGLQRF